MEEGETLVIRVKPNDVKLQVTRSSVSGFAYGPKES